MTLAPSPHRAADPYGPSRRARRAAADQGGGRRLPVCCLRGVLAQGRWCARPGDGSECSRPRGGQRAIPRARRDSLTRRRRSSSMARSTSWLIPDTALPSLHGLARRDRCRCWAGTRTHGRKHLAAYLRAAWSPTRRSCSTAVAARPPDTKRPLDRAGVPVVTTDVQAVHPDRAPQVVRGGRPPAARAGPGRWPGAPSRRCRCRTARRAGHAPAARPLGGAEHRGRDQGPAVAGPVGRGRGGHDHGVDHRGARSASKQQRRLTERVAGRDVVERRDRPPGHQRPMDGRKLRAPARVGGTRPPRAPRRSRASVPHGRRGHRPGPACPGAGPRRADRPRAAAGTSTIPARHSRPAAHQAAQQQVEEPHRRRQLVLEDDPGEERPEERVQRSARRSRGRAAPPPPAGRPAAPAAVRCPAHTRAADAASSTLSRGLPIGEVAVVQRAAQVAARVGQPVSLRRRRARAPHG